MLTSLTFPQNVYCADVAFKTVTFSFDAVAQWQQAAALFPLRRQTLPALEPLVISCVVQCDNLTCSFRQITNTQTEFFLKKTVNLQFEMISKRPLLVE